MRAEIQRIPEPAGCLRLWHNDAHGHGDPYQFAATARWTDPRSIELMGVCNPIDGEMAQAIKAAAAREDAHRVKVTRIKSDRIITRWHQCGPTSAPFIPRPNMHADVLPLIEYRNANGQVEREMIVDALRDEDANVLHRIMVLASKGLAAELSTPRDDAKRLPSMAE